MNPYYYEDEHVTLYHGDCLEVMRTLPDSSVESVVCDPPYGLANTDPAHVAETITRWVNGERDYLPGGAGFMGKAWDAFVPPVAVWDECMRVLKPGGHVLAFAGSRTVDLMTLGIRLAGFDIRDSIAWLYGSGFPKSLDVSKAIDKAAPRVGMFDAFAAHFRDRRAASGLTQKAIAQHFPSKTGGLTGCVWNWENAANVPTLAQWKILAPMLGLSDEWRPLIERVEAEREVIEERRVTDRRGDGTVVGLGHAGNADITAPATPDAERWQGWGTALKPAFEPVVVARKPLAGTVAANVLEHGTGALNIDGCRISTDDDTGRVRTRNTAMPGDDRTDSSKGNMYGPGHRYVSTKHDSGRWPTNVVLDGSQAEVLDEQSGESKSPPVGSVANTKGGNTIGTFAHEGRAPSPNGHGDKGGASRFFPTFRYEAKAPTSERPKVNGTAHPTVKPLALMSWLVRLVTPPGGTVLEPFAGSGTTVEAAVVEGFHCIAIEREADYLPLIMSRIHRRRDPVVALKLTNEDLGLFEEPA